MNSLSRELIASLKMQSRQGAIFIRFVLAVCHLLCLGNYANAQTQRVWSATNQIAGNIYTFAGKRH